MRFVLRVSEEHGWVTELVDIDAPSDILALEALERRGYSLPEGNKKKIGSFWKGVAQTLASGKTHVLMPESER